MTRFNQQGNLIGQSKSFLERLEQIYQIDPLSKPALIISERGTSKELVIASLHFLSKRWKQSYLKLNGVALNEKPPKLAAFGQVRADLLDRLSFGVITLPPLRERVDDILMLAEYFAINMVREIELIQSTFAHCQFNQKKTAEALELTYHQLRGYLKKYNLLNGSLNDEL